MGTTSSKAPGGIDLEDFEFLYLIGKGAWGKVWQVRKKDDSMIYAMKVLKKDDVYQTDSIDHIKFEREVLERCGGHPFITHLHFAFQTKDKLYFVLEFINGGNLYHQLQHRDFNEPETCFISAEIIIALDFLHSQNILYRDLKLENILLDMQGHVRLTDFGLSAQVESVRKRHHSFSGTAIYLAPEIIDDLNSEERHGHDLAVDYWALGVVIHLMLTKAPPFFDEDKTKLYEQILSKEIQVSEALSSPAQSVIRGLLHKKAEKRLGSSAAGVKTLKSHPFFKGLNWAQIEKAEAVPPFVPKSTSYDDLQNMDMKIPYGEQKSSTNVTNKNPPKRTSHFRKFPYAGSQSRTNSSPNMISPRKVE